MDWRGGIGEAGSDCVWHRQCGCAFWLVYILPLAYFVFAERTRAVRVCRLSQMARYFYRCEFVTWIMAWVD